MHKKRKEKTLDRHLALRKRLDKETVQSPRAWKMARYLHCNRNLLGFDTASYSLLFPMAKCLMFFAILVLLSGCSNGASNEKIASIEARLEQLEARSTQNEEQINQITLLEKRIGNLEQSLAKLDKLVAENIKKNIAQETRIEPRAAYHVVQQGEILSMIARRYGMSLDELCRLNKITPKTVIHPGQQLMVTSPE